MPNKRVSVKGKGAELFFGDIAEPLPSPLAAPSEAVSEEPYVDQDASAATDVAESAPVAVQRSPRASSAKRKPRPTRATTDAAPSNISAPEHLDDADRLEVIGTIIKHPGREVSFVRLSPEEKARLADIVYEFKRQGLKVTETEIHRIGLNSLLLDYDQRGTDSLLARLITRLKA
jgi:hypothetical protein